MSYSFSLKSNEKEMKNYFKNISGINIKDTIFIKVKTMEQEDGFNIKEVLNVWKKNQIYFLMKL